MELVINDQEHIELSQLANEKGVYASDHLVIPGSTYTVKVSAPNLPSANSVPIYVPLNLPEVKAERIRNVQGEINHQTPQDLVSLYFTDNEFVTDKYYNLTFLSFYDKDTLSANPYGAIDNIPAKENNCHTWSKEKISTYYNEFLGRTLDRYATTFLVKSKCLPDTKTPLKFYIETGIQNPKRDIQWAYKVTMNIEVVTKETFDYAKIEYDQPEGLDHLVLPPQRALTNIKNGYGLIFASNEKIIEIP